MNFPVFFSFSAFLFSLGTIFCINCLYQQWVNTVPLFQRNSVLLKMLSITVASGIFIIAISALGQLCVPHLKVGKYIRESQSLSSSEVESLLHQSLDDAEVCNMYASTNL